MDKDKYYEVAGHDGVAFRFVGYAKTWEPDVVDEAEDGWVVDGEWVDDVDRAIVVMVGDDHKYEVAVDDCAEIPDDAFCAGCGQIGCAHDGRVRE